MSPSHPLASGWGPLVRASDSRLHEPALGLNRIGNLAECYLWTPSFVHDVTVTWPGRRMERLTDARRNSSLCRRQVLLSRDREHSGDRGRRFGYGYIKNSADPHQALVAIGAGAVGALDGLPYLLSGWEGEVAWSQGSS